MSEMEAMKSRLQDFLAVVNRMGDPGLVVVPEGAWETALPVVKESASEAFGESLTFLDGSGKFVQDLVVKGFKEGAVQCLLLPHQVPQEFLPFFDQVCRDQYLQEMKEGVWQKVPLHPAWRLVLIVSSSARGVQDLQPMFQHHLSL